MASVRLGDMEQNSEVIALADKLGLTVRQLALYVMGQITQGYTYPTALTNAEKYFTHNSFNTWLRGK